jgi:sugar/nucleoside kinase (ribokinase family)
MQELQPAGVDLSRTIRVNSVPTAAAAVLVQQDTGENQICVGLGANRCVHADQLTDDVLRDATVLVLQVRVLSTLDVPFEPQLRY